MVKTKLPNYSLSFNTRDTIQILSEYIYIEIDLIAEIYTNTVCPKKNVPR